MRELTFLKCLDLVIVLLLLLIVKLESIEKIIFFKDKNKRARLLIESERYNFDRVNNINCRKNFKCFLIATKAFKILTTKIKFYKQ